MKKATPLIIISICIAIAAISRTFIHRDIRTDTNSEPPAPFYLSDSNRYFSEDSRRNPDPYMIQQPEMEELIKDMDFLSESEKQQLLEDEKKASQYYEKANKLHLESESIADQIYKKNDSIFEKREHLMNEHNDLWEKLLDSASEEDRGIEDNRKFILSSKTLTQDEKDILLLQEDKLDAIDQEIKAVYDEIDLATRELVAEIDECYRKADEIHDRSQAIWHKIYSHNDVTLYNLSE